MSRRKITAITAVALAGLMPASAAADLAGDMTAELQAAGVPNPHVVVAIPAPASQAELDAFQAGAEEGPSMTNDNLISPAPTNPLPLGRVSYGSTVAMPYPGYQAPVNEGSWPALEDANGPVWRLAVMTTLRRMLAGGAVLSGVSMAPSFPNRVGSGPDYWSRRPDATEFPPTRLAPSLPAATAEAEVKSGLDALHSTAEVVVRGWAGGERLLEVTMPVGSLDYQFRDLPGLASYLLDEQLSLNDQGGAIGGVVLRVEDIATGRPLSTYAGDATSGQQFQWFAPIVQAFAGPPTPGGELVEDLEQTVTDLTTPDSE